MLIQFNKLWNNHPYTQSPCNKAIFKNQCAIRMGIAMESSGIDTTSFDKIFPKRRCYPGFKHNPAHILSAEEMAKWMSSKAGTFGQKVIIKNDRQASLKNKKGFVFIFNGWDSGDHIDLWDGNKLRAGEPEWIDLGDELWFWEIKNQ